MTSLIINMPQLQNRRQRHGATLLSLLCWAWFLMPLAIVGGWLMGMKMLAQEVVWLGGWQSLLRLTEFAAGLNAGLALAWTLWAIIGARRGRARSAPAAMAVDAAAALGADPREVAAAMGARAVTVYFHAGGVVARVQANAAPAIVQADPRFNTVRLAAAG